MKNLLKLSLLALFLITLGPLHAAPLPTPAKPDIQAKAYLLLDLTRGQVLAETNADGRIEPASLTKMMTAYVVSAELATGRVTLQDRVRISEKAWRQEGSRMFVEVNTFVTVEELLKGLIIQSGNDAAVALAEHLAGSEEAFAALMNREAQRLDLKDTHFVNSTGLPDPNHYSTAHDLARLASAIVRDFPDHYSWYAAREFTYNKITQPNRNLLLWRDASVDGIKTGHTQSAGYCLVASAKRGEMRLISVVIGTSSEELRAKESMKLLGYGFGFFETHKLYDANQPLATRKVWKGEQDTVELGLQQPLYVTVPRGYYNELKAALNVEKTIIAPLHKGDPLGSVVVRLADQTLATPPLVALADRPEGGFFTRLIDTILLWFE
ncbi:MAG TPA: D-alanyl-D-alanine carboxypeptidase family protein [Gammaproteobacteria bacterium]